MPQLLSILLFSFLQLAGIADEEVEMVFVGDAMQHRPQIIAASRPDGSMDYSKCFSFIADDIALADYAVANLEVPLAGKPYAGYPVFSGPDEFAKHLGDSGFDLLLTANNHSLDRGSRGVKRTVQVLRQMGIPSIGTYSSSAQRDSVMPYIANVKGKRIAILNYTYGTNGMPMRDGIVIDLIDRNAISADIAAARDMGAQVICVCMHWGTEYRRTPDSEQASLTDFLIDEGVDLIVGSHPHVVQPFEMRYSHKHGKEVAIIYSLGNFISNQNDIDSRGGALARVKIKFRGDSLCGIEMGYKLLFCQKPQKSHATDNYMLIPASMPDSVRADQRAAFTQFVARTRSLLKQHNSPEVEELP